MVRSSNKAFAVLNVYSVHTSHTRNEQLLPDKNIAIQSSSNLRSVSSEPYVLTEIASYHSNHDHYNQHSRPEDDSPTRVISKLAHPSAMTRVLSAQ
jgi:hypothetical protein